MTTIDAVEARRREERRAWHVGVAAAELGLLALGLAGIAGYRRLFDGWGWFWRLALVLAAAQLLAAVLRRRNVGTAWSVTAAAVLGPVVIGAVILPQTTFLGLPTPATWAAVVDSIREAFGQFPKLIAPVEALPGFLIVVAVVLWTFATFADLCLLRLAAPVQAAVPYVSMFVFGSVLARDTARFSSAAWFVAGMAVYVIGARARRSASFRWLRGETLAGLRATTLSVAAALTIALAVGAVVGPRLPGANADPVFNVRDLGGSQAVRTVRSPFVGLREQLGARSDAVMFRATSSAPTYWRLTSLDSYDPTRDAWVPRAGYQRVEGELPRAGDTDGRTVRLTQRITVEELDSVFMPAAFEAVSVSAGFDVSYNPATSSLVVARGERIPTSSSYDVISELADPRRNRLGGARVGDPGGGYLDVPVQLGPEARRIVAGIPAGMSTLDRALALQNLLRGWTYSTDADFSDQQDPLDAFLLARSGFCQQYSSAFALLARAMGIPSRVAVGFTFGERDATTGEWIVRGRHAHAWPEVFFAGAGWVPFEPTPGRGNPQLEQLTGIPPQQAVVDETPEGTTTTAPSTTAAPTTLPPSTTTPAQPNNPGVTPNADADTGRAGGPWWRWPATVLALVVVAPIMLLLGRSLRRVRRRRRAGSDAALGVELAWIEAVEAVSAFGVRPRHGETPAEFGARVSRLFDLAAMDRLARLETARRFRSTSPTGAERDAAMAASAEVRGRVADQAGPVARMIGTAAGRFGSRFAAVTPRRDEGDGGDGPPRQSTT